MRYKIYYSNGVYDSMSSSKPLPRDVQVIVQEHPDVGWHTQSGYDYYIWRDSRWVGVDRAGLFDQMKEDGVAKFNIGIYHEVFHNDEWAVVNEYGLYEWIEETGYALFGRTLTQKKFNSVMASALEGLGEAKTGWMPDEKKPNG